MWELNIIFKVCLWTATKQSLKPVLYPSSISQKKALELTECFTSSCIFLFFLMFHSLFLSKGILKSISSTFYEQILRKYSFAKKFQRQTLSREKLCKSLMYEKAVHKMLVKLTLNCIVGVLIPV